MTKKEAMEALKTTEPFTRKWTAVIENIARHEELRFDAEVVRLARALEANARI